MDDHFVRTCFRKGLEHIDEVAKLLRRRGSGVARAEGEILVLPQLSELLEPVDQEKGARGRCRVWIGLDGLEFVPEAPKGFLRGGGVGALHFVGQAGQEPIQQGPQGRVYELRVKGEPDEFIKALVREGYDCHDTDEDIIRVVVPGVASAGPGERDSAAGDDGARRLFQLAAREHAQVRHLRPSVPTLEDVFARAVGEV